jgi:hypothetical protein
MPAEFILTALTRDPEVASMAERGGVNRVGIDIERLGKPERQSRGGDLRYSDHELEDLAAVAARVAHAAVFVRVNPLHDGSEAEIGRALELGARVIMLPYFTSAREAAWFVDTVGGRAEPVLLVETAEAAARIREIAAVPGVAEIMVGLNDLSLSLGLSHPFETLTSGAVDSIAGAVHEAGLRFGFGGVARPGDETLPVPPDLIYAQYARLGANSAWLARSFYRGIGAHEIPAAVGEVRRRLAHWFAQPPSILKGECARLEGALRAASPCSQ